MRVALCATAGILSALAQGDRFPPVEVSTGIRAARARFQVRLPQRDLSGT